LRRPVTPPPQATCPRRRRSVRRRAGTDPRARPRHPRRPRPAARRSRMQPGAPHPEDAPEAGGPLTMVTIRTQVRLHVRAADGRLLEADAYTFEGLTDRLEHLAL